MKQLAFSLAVLLAVGIARPAFAADAAVPKLVEQAQASFDAGHFLDAAAKFEDAYKKSHQLSLLGSAAEAYRRQFEVDQDTAHLERARGLLTNFIVVTDDPALRSNAQRALADIELLMRSAGKTPSSDPGGFAVPCASGGSARGENREPVYKQWWLWTIVSVALVGAVTGLAIGLSRPGAPDTMGGNYRPRFQ